MGIDINGAKFLAFAKSCGVDFTRPAMIGRQRLHVSQDAIRQLLMSCGQDVSEADLADICHGADGYSENLFRFLGASAAVSFDYSDYENPSYTHDMNEPIPEAFKDAYTVVFDGGSLEHIFNFPVAIKNCMEMVRVGGHYLAITPANNFFGHGFYQFSPELYFTVLSAGNGFKVETLLAFEERPNPVWYAVKSPREVAARVTLTNSSPVFLLVIARKIALRPIFKDAPQQSDYVALWSGNGSEPMTGSRRLESVRRPLPIRIAKKVLPVRARTWLRRAFEHHSSEPRGFDPRFFERMEWPADRTAIGSLPRSLVKKVDLEPIADG